MTSGKRSVQERRVVTFRYNKDEVTAEVTGTLLTILPQRRNRPWLHVKKRANSTNSWTERFQDVG